MSKSPVVQVFYNISETVRQNLTSEEQNNRMADLRFTVTLRRELCTVS